MKISQRPLGNQPAELTSFVGRKAELAQIKQLLVKHRLVTLTGAGGVGKSRTATEAARRLARAWRDGTWLVELAGFDVPALLPNVIAGVLGVREQPGRPLLTTLIDHLQARQLLIVLDNCEHLLEASAQCCDALLRGCPLLRILATSRQPMGIPGEATLALAPLLVPAEDDGGAAALLMQFDAVRLFVERAGSAVPDFVLNDDNKQAVAALTRKLEGMPLELELAAVLMRTLGLKELVERLGDRFTLLDMGHRTAWPRDRSLRTTIDWSYDLLSEAERLLWRRLSVFAGSFTLPAAEAVCADAHVPLKGIASTLAGLVEKSIVSRNPAGGDTRYRMLETLRQYARERLREAGEEDALVKAHYGWCAETGLRPGGAWWTGRQQSQWLVLMKAEQPNLRAALDACLRRSERAEAGLHLAVRLFLYWIVQNHQDEASHYIDGFLAGSAAPSASRAGALFVRGFIARGKGNLECARASYEECRRLSIEHGYDREQGWALAGLALLELIELAALAASDERSARFRRLRADLDAAVELLERSGDCVIRAWAVCLLGELHAQLGDIGKAQAVIQDSVALSQSAGDVWAQSYARARLGIVYWQRGEFASGLAHLRQAICAQHEIGHRWGMAMSLEGLAYIAASTEQPEKAARLLGAVERLWSQVGFKIHELLKIHRERCMAAAKKALGEARFRDAYEQGAALALGNVLDFALDAPESRQVEPVKRVSPRLSRREMDVVRLVADGATNREIATALIVAERTVKTHIENVMNKLGVDSRVQIAVWFTHHGDEPSKAAADSGGSSVN